MNRILELTPTQRRIAMGLIAGNPMAEICEDLAMSQKQVNVELGWAQRKTNAATVYQLVAMVAADLVRIEAVLK